MYDLVIIGSGPAGLAAAIYAQRAMLKTLVLEASYVSGGQIINTYEIDNYPGFPGENGMNLGKAFREHADKLGAEFVTARVTGIEAGDVKVVHTKKGDYETKAIIIATGAVNRKLGVAGEEEFSGMGVSYCATCDGAFFKGMEVAVCGGGDVALEDALYLARACTKVHLIHRRNEFRGAKCLEDQVRATSNIEIHTPAVIKEIKGSEAVAAITVENTETGMVEDIPVRGSFIAVGMTPNTGFLKGVVELNDAGYVVAGEDTKTNIPGIYAAGDVRTKRLRQVITAAADGAVAVTYAEEYIREH